MLTTTMKYAEKYNYLDEKISEGILLSERDRSSGTACRERSDRRGRDLCKRAELYDNDTGRLSV